MCEYLYELSTHRCTVVGTKGALGVVVGGWGGWGGTWRCEIIGGWVVGAIFKFYYIFMTKFFKVYPSLFAFTVRQYYMILMNIT
jgi:hypothetical protein